MYQDYKKVLFFILKKAMMLKFCKSYKHVNKDPVNKVI